MPQNMLYKSEDNYNYWILTDRSFRVIDQYQYGIGNLGSIWNFH